MFISLKVMHVHSRQLLTGWSPSKYYLDQSETEVNRPAGHPQNITWTNRSWSS